MDEPGSPAWVERVVRRSAGTGYTVSSGSVWLLARPNGAQLPAQGWKLHVSSRVSLFPALVEKLVPLLTTEGCLFKVARSQKVFRDLNVGVTAPATVGKAFTVYPDQDRVRELGVRLAGALRGHAGPRVLSDRRVLADAPVYYRYGPLVGNLSYGEHGQPGIRLHGPGGDEFDGLAGLTYRQPSWAIDPFATSGHAQVGGGSLIGEHYRIVTGIRQAAQGNVYRAVDTHDNHAVVVKQARAHVADYGEGNDTRLRLRNERRILTVLAGVAGVPQFLDHFRHGDDEFLVTSDCGPDSLVRDIGRHGPYRQGRGARGLDSLAAGLARILLAVHERGVLMRDLSPANIVLGDEPSIIDFGLAAHGGLHIAGGTPGYAPAHQLRDEPPSDTDDLYALGMVLLFAATGLHPVTTGDDPELPRVRALQTIRRHHGTTPGGVIAAIVDLLGTDGERARTAGRRLADGSGEHRPVSVPSCPEIPDVTAELAAEITGNMLDELLDRLNRVLEAPDSSLAGGEVSLYFGSAGIGLELLHHRQRHPAVDRTVRELAAFTARIAGQANQSPGLFSGATGTDLFLRAAAQTGLGAPRWPGRRLPPPDWQATPVDLIEGQAGVGLGHLWLYQATGDPADLAVAQHCATAVSAEPQPARKSAPGRADTGLGRAHGLAGAIELLIGLAAQTAAPQAFETAANRASHLAALAEPLTVEAGYPTAEPMTLSWCRGMSGIGQTLLHASTLLGEPDLADLTRRIADVCAHRVAQLNSLGQCCGATGVGNFLLDLAAHDQSERYLQAAFDVATHLLLRSGGPPERPRFVSTHTASTRSLSWAQGLTGILGFFRRLADGCPSTQSEMSPLAL